MFFNLLLKKLSLITIIFWQNHNPLADNGAQNAYDILSPIWGGLSITVRGTTFDAETDQGWLKYDTESFGTVVDRFRWEGGCIVEHVSLI